MKKKKYFMLSMLFLLAVAMFSACDNDDETPVSTCISGTVLTVIDDLVFINDLKMPTGDNKYSYIKGVVVAKDEFPIQNYKTGDVVNFNIIEVISPYPVPVMPSPDPTTNYRCSIEICK